MSIKLEEGKFYKTKNELKVECLKDMPATREGYSKVCVIYREGEWEEVSYAENGLYYTENPCHARTIVSEWSEVDEMGIKINDVAYFANDPNGGWRVGLFAGTDYVSDSPFMLKQIIGTEFVTYYKHISKTNPDLEK